MLKTQAYQHWHSMAFKTTYPMNTHMRRPDVRPLLQPSEAPRHLVAAQVHLQVVADVVPEAAKDGSADFRRGFPAGIFLGRVSGASPRNFTSSSSVLTRVLAKRGSTRVLARQCQVWVETLSADATSA